MDKYSFNINKYNIEQVRFSVICNDGARLTVKDIEKYFTLGKSWADLREFHYLPPPPPQNGTQKERGGRQKNNKTKDKAIKHAGLRLETGGFKSDCGVIFEKWDPGSGLSCRAKNTSGMCFQGVGLH